MIQDLDVDLIDISDTFYEMKVETYVFDIYVSRLRRVVGRCELRMEHGRDLLFYGNIGYVIYRPYRGHNFAYKACVGLLNLIPKLKPSLTEVIITCNPDNVASRKTIQKLGAVYQGTVDVDEDHELFLFGETQKEVYHIRV